MLLYTVVYSANVARLSFWVIPLLLAAVLYSMCNKLLGIFMRKIYINYFLCMLRWRWFSFFIFRMLFAFLLSTRLSAFAYTSSAITQQHCSTVRCGSRIIVYTVLLAMGFFSSRYY